MTDSAGEKCAVILIDTQGVFDVEMSLDESKSLFSLSVLLSSVQIFNKKDKIEIDDLCWLESFTEFSHHVSKTQGQHGQATLQPPFQELIFLIRDWDCVDDNAHGWEGGEEYLDT